jgi:hypothetical protein
MIQKTDLRIGNHLQYFIGYGGSDWENTKIDWQDLKWCEENNENFNEVHKAIPITEGILWANKFECGEGGWWMNAANNLRPHYLKLIYTVDDGWYPIYIEQPEMSSESEQMVSLRKIEYIHELENLFFVLTGKELNLKL